MLGTAALGPTLTTSTVRQVGGYPGYTGRDANIVAEAALGPIPAMQPAAHSITSSARSGIGVSIVTPGQAFADQGTNDKEAAEAGAGSYLACHLGPGPRI